MSKDVKRFSKTIEQTDTGMVIATVFNLATGKRVGLEFFGGLFYSQQQRLIKAHSWADKWITNCEAYCTEEPT